MTSRIGGILLLLTLLVPPLLTWGYLDVQKYLTKKEVKQILLQRVDRLDLVRISLTSTQQKAELRWEHDREFEYKHQMYDIVHTERNGDTTHYWCYWDHKESKLNAYIDDFLHSILTNNPIDKDSRERLLDFFKTFFKVDVVQGYAVDCYYAMTSEAPIYNLINNIEAPLVPPPQIS